MEWLVREEVALLLATLAACGLLILGTLELIWPTRPRRAGRPRPAPPRAGGPPSRSQAPPEEDRASVALRVSRALLERALEDPDPASDRRVRTIWRAIACLGRGLEAAPGDARLRECLAAAHAALVMRDERGAFRELAAAAPWWTTVFAHTAPAPDPKAV
ncbi:MAG: hypothetical protein HYV94_21755 [Candidatus Rokubacteria bacterium]|nr:hypothetical protein [Candidatus Rokubacteria bacterium]